MSGNIWRAVIPATRPLVLRLHEKPPAHWSYVFTKDSYFSELRHTPEQRTRNLATQGWMQRPSLWQLAPNTINTKPLYAEHIYHIRFVHRHFPVRFMKKMHNDWATSPVQ